MSLFFARLGNSEFRHTALTLWKSGKRKRGGWVCQSCRATTAAITRGYGDDAIRSPRSRNPVSPHTGREPFADNHVKVDLRNEEGDSGLKSPTIEGNEARHSPSNPNVQSVQMAQRQTPPPRVSDLPREQARKEQTIIRHSSSAESASDTSQAPDSESGRPDVEKEQAQNELWERFERSEESDSNGVDVADEALDADDGSLWNAPLSTARMRDRARSSKFDDARLLDLDYHALLSDALLRREVDIVARCLFTASRKGDTDFLRAIPPVQFSEILELLQPANSISKLASTHIELSAAVARHLGLAAMASVAWEYAEFLIEVIKVRKAAGVRLTLLDYTILLRSARDLGNQRLSVRLWEELQDSEHIPSTACWNYFLSGHAWKGIHRAKARHRVRVLPFYMLARKTVHLGEEFRNYRVGDGGLKEDVIRSFNRMLRDGAIANEETFVEVIVAAGREGDLATIKLILRNVWKIEVDALMAGQEENTIVPDPMTKDSPLHPSAKLLFALAHVFGINNDVPTALRLIDFVARHYELGIDKETWKQLFEWTFVLATPRTHAQRLEDGSKVGQLPLPSVLNLWETMIGAPYAVRPTMGMYNHLMKNLLHRDLTPAIFDKLHEAMPIYRAGVGYASCTYHRLKRALHHKPNRKSGPTVQQLRSAYENANLIRQRNHFWVKRWMRLLFASLRTRAGRDSDDDILLRQIPCLLHDYQDLVPASVQFEVPGGTLEFKVHEDDQKLESGIRLWQRRLKGRKVLDRIPRLVGDESYETRDPQPSRRLRRAGIGARHPLREDPDPGALDISRLVGTQW